MPGGPAGEEGGLAAPAAWAYPVLVLTNLTGELQGIVKEGEIDV